MLDVIWNMAAVESNQEKIDPDKDCHIAWRNWQQAAKDRMLAEALAIQKEDEEACRKMGEYGLSLLRPGMGILTHCNAGALATAKYGTCLSPIHLGQEKGYDFRVFADETRPLLQGARLTAYSGKCDISRSRSCHYGRTAQVRSGAEEDTFLKG